MKEKDTKWVLNPKHTGGGAVDAAVGASGGRSGVSQATHSWTVVGLWVVQPRRAATRGINRSFGPQGIFEVVVGWL